MKIILLCCFRMKWWSGAAVESKRFIVEAHLSKVHLLYCSKHHVRAAHAIIKTRFLKLPSILTAGCWLPIMDLTLKTWQDTLCGPAEGEWLLVTFTNKTAKQAAQSARECVSHIVYDLVVLYRLYESNSWLTGRRWLWWNSRVILWRLSGFREESWDETWSSIWLHWDVGTLGAKSAFSPVVPLKTFLNHHPAAINIHYYALETSIFNHNWTKPPLNKT